ncbi:MAG: FAD-dependent oxidoreductase [Chloroflexota bacterium]|nr:FAD-dependent oxidoreductase [Chloroflexota bacterium]
MAKVVFSSWAGKVVDNRGLKVEEYALLEELSLLTECNHAKVAAFMGWDGFVVLNEKANVVDMAYAYAKEAEKISCGECSIGRIGMGIVVDTLSRIVEGKGREGDIELLQWIGKGMEENCKCVFCQTAVVPIMDSIEHYKEEYLDLIRNKKAAPRSDYKVKVTAPCMEACPAHLDIPGYIELIKNQRQGESLGLIREGVCLPATIGRVCTAPCEDACRRKDMDGPLAIRALKRYVADWELEQGLIPPVSKPKKAGEKVAIIGAGPAGLAAGYNLALKGYRVTIFEELPVVGGMAAVGIPQYRLPKNILNREIEIIKGMGVEIKLNTKVGEDILIEGLWKDGYKAVFVAVGAHKSRDMGVGGEDQSYEGFIDGVKFLRDMNLGRRIEPKDKVLIVGGGDVAVDCARSCLRLGFRDVNIVYRRSLVEMPARETEIEEAEKEGVKINYLVTPTKILADNGKVVGAECIKMELGEPDASGRRRPIPIKGSEFTINADMVIPAIGQEPDLSCLAGEDQVKFTSYMTVDADPDTCQTNREGIFSAGDCVTGPAILIDAVAAGNRAAQSIDQYIREGKVSQNSKMPGVVPGIELAAQREKEVVARKAPQVMDRLPIEARIRGFLEVEQSFGPEAALEEAKRCLRCYRVMLWATAE